MQAAELIPAESVRAELARVLERSEFHEPKSLLASFMDWLLPRLGAREVEILGDVVRGLLFAGAALVLVLAARRIARAFLGRSRPPEAAARPAPAALEARLVELAAAARAARGQGDLRGALRLLFRALLLALGGQGDLEVRPAWTNRELLRRGRPSGATRALLEGLVRELEPKEFGRAPVGAADVERLEGLLAPHLARAEGRA
jgi:hypothetical protein